MGVGEGTAVAVDVGEAVGMLVGVAERRGCGGYSQLNLCRGNGVAVATCSVAGGSVAEITGVVSTVSVAPQAAKTRINTKK
ncbi:MAG: hypothetical protein M5U34_26110 [Chloroflexi bacterium]|nr:hypothetical protein [Chloroflexota bacterium]